MSERTNGMDRLAPMDLLFAMGDLGVEIPVADDAADTRGLRALVREINSAAGANTSTQSVSALRRRRSLTRVRSGRWPRRRTLRGRAAGALLAIVASAGLALLITVGGGGSSVVARAYAATDPAGVIVHYVETTSFQQQSGSPQTLEVWIYGDQSHQILNPEDPKNRQDIVASHGHVYTLMDGQLMTSLYSPAEIRCPAAGILSGCVLSDNNSPIAALRALYRSGEIHLTGHTTLDGRRLDVLTGRSGNLTIRALVDGHTFVPVKVTMTRTLIWPRTKVPRAPSTVIQTITDYQRLPVTASNLRRLALPPHRHARVLRSFPCRRLFPGCAATKHTSSR
jgi:hypothetical protein